MSGVFYHSVIHGSRFFYVLYFDKTWVFDQLERAQGPIYIITLYMGFWSIFYSPV